MAAEMSSPQAAVGDSDQLGDGRSALQVEVFTVPKKASEPHTKLSGAALMFKSSVFRNAARNLVLIGVWYFLSTFLTLYNKVLLGQHKGIFGDSGFPAPLFMTALQFMFQWLLSSIVLYAPCCSPTKAQEPFDFYEWLTKVGQSPPGIFCWPCV